MDNTRPATCKKTKSTIVVIYDIGQVFQLILNQEVIQVIRHETDDRFICMTNVKTKDIGGEPAKQNFNVKENIKCLHV